MGKTISNNGNANANPPITAIAKGWCSCAPAPIPKARGIKAITAAKAVINFGLSRAAIEYSIFSSWLNEPSLS